MLERNQQWVLILGLIIGCTATTKRTESGPDAESAANGGSHETNPGSGAGGEIDIDASATDSDGDGAVVAEHHYPVADTPLPPPDCGQEVAVGMVRAQVPFVIGRVAIDELGQIYAPYGTFDDHIGLMAIDPCGKTLWQVIVADETPSWGMIAARLIGEDEVLLDASENAIFSQAIWRFDRSGNQLQPYPNQGRITSVLGVTAENELVVSTYVSASSVEDSQKYIARLSADGEYRQLVKSGMDLSTEECGVYGNIIGCYSNAFDLQTLELIWSRSKRIVDGTTRNVVNPALDGNRIYTVEYGVESYRLVARSLVDGSEAISYSLGPSPSGQNGLQIGGPVLGANGWVYVYIDFLGRDDPQGQLAAFDRDGELKWLYAASTDSTSYNGHATHVVGRNDVVYLAIGSAIHAVDAITGYEIWKQPMLARFVEPGVTLSPNGDLLVRTQSNVLMLIATSSSGGAGDSPWPAPGGDRRNINTR